MEIGLERMVKMIIKTLSSNWKFSDKNAHAEPLYVSQNGRVILFTLEPGQTIREHNAPSSPFYAVIIDGKGYFTGREEKEQLVSPGNLVIFDPGENHSIRAIEELVFIGILHGVPLKAL